MKKLLINLLFIFTSTHTAFYEPLKQPPKADLFILAARYFKYKTLKTKQELDAALAQATPEEKQTPDWIGIIKQNNPSHGLTPIMYINNHQPQVRRRG